MRCHILPGNRIINSLQYSAIARNQEVTRLTHNSTELKFEVKLELIGLNPHPIPTSTQSKYRTFSR